MVKKTAATREKPVTTLEIPLLAPILALAASSEVIAFEKRMSDAESRAENARNNATYFLRQADEATQTAGVFAREAAGFKPLLAGAKRDAKKRIAEAAKPAAEVEARVRKHRMAGDMAVSGTVLTVNTPLLFADIRVAAGEDEKRRACLGAFQFQFDFARARVHVRNLVFTSRHPHWSANTSGQPCLGEYEAEIIRLFGKGDVYGLVDNMYQWVIGVDRDAHSYQSSHQWRDARVSPSGEDISEGDLVIGIDEWDGRDLTGMTGEVAEEDGSDDGMVRVDFRTGLGWWTSRHVLHPITSDQYHAAERYVIENGNGEDTLRKVDALPDTATIEDAQKIMAHVEPLKLTPITREAVAV